MKQGKPRNIRGFPYIYLHVLHFLVESLDSVDCLDIKVRS